MNYPSGKHIGIVKAPAIFSSGEAGSVPPHPGSTRVLKEYGFDDAKIDELRSDDLVDQKRINGTRISTLQHGEAEMAEPAAIRKKGRVTAETPLVESGSPAATAIDEVPFSNRADTGDPRSRT